MTRVARAPTRGRVLEGYSSCPSARRRREILAILDPYTGGRFKTYANIGGNTCSGRRSRFGDALGGLGRADVLRLIHLVRDSSRGRPQ